MNRPGLSLHVGQHLVLTPQLQQSIRLLQMSAQELAQEVAQMLEDNPFLEPAGPHGAVDAAAADGGPNIEGADTEGVDTATDAWPDTGLHASAHTWPGAGDVSVAASDAQPLQDDPGWDDLHGYGLPHEAGTHDSGWIDAGLHEAGLRELDVPTDWGAASGGDGWEDGWTGAGGTEDVVEHGAEYGVEYGGESGMHDSIPIAGSSAATADDSDAVLACTAAPRTLADYLHDQARLLPLGELDSAALHYLIDSLDDDGYLHDPLPAVVDGLLLSAQAREAELADTTDATTTVHEALLHHFTVALRLLHTLEPVGVGARDLSECLRLQLRHLSQRPPQGSGPDAATLALAERICDKPLQDLGRRGRQQQIRYLQQCCGAASPGEVGAALDVIARLEPRPGRPFAATAAQVVVPDVIVSFVPLAAGGRRAGRGLGSELVVALNPDAQPRLRIHQLYANALRHHREGQGYAALQQRLQEARWFIRNLRQRFDTILRVSRAIVQRQKSFFVHGELAMRPLVLRDIAEELGLHESTISRVTTAKYMGTPRGVYELKYFFGSGLGTDTGGNASSIAVRALIKQFIADEDPRKPLSDNEIAARLQAQGIECARRTVAKYREGLKIPVASQRQQG